ncbi:MAG TPA: glycosyltransferase family 2 protein [Rectinema sp.]|nr:glycosyltransferase family 2 protein [Rectinema sp.]
MINALLTAYGLIIFAACVFFFFITVSNILWLMHTLTIERKKTGPSVAVLIPARNEALRIRPCIDSLLCQNYSSYQIYVIDDNSSDETWNILQSYMIRFPSKFKAFKAEPLPEGWYGKPHALQELATHVKEDYLLCTDADTIHKPDSISKAIAAADKYKADLITGYPHHSMPTFAEAAVVPSMYILTMLGMPLYLIPATKSPLFSHAIGQFMLFKRSFFEKIGGYEKVKHEATEDVRLSRIIKEHGGKIAFIDLKDIVECRMYTTYKEAIQGIAKNAYDYLGKNLFILFSGTVAVPLVFYIPLIVLFFDIPWLGPAIPYLKASAIITFYSWVLETIDRRLPWYIPFIYPLIFVNTMSALWRGFRLVNKEGGIEWKGRKVK